jgi:hypothetical protein
MGARSRLCESLGAINFAAGCLDPEPLILIIGFVIATEHGCMSACIH